eukprot:Nitzschia sp. Nitz4//scaffold5_size260463//47960//48601//NITZ4_000951-RA/size260463-processed-gene-0.115-mRNA-1//-1//CDS//3329555247//5142//frame0
MYDPMESDDGLWFPECDPFASELAPAAVSEDEDNFNDLLKMVDSMDAEDSLKPGVYAENLSDFGNQQHLLSLQRSEPLHSMYWEPPVTPPTTKPSFNKLPSIVSPENLQLDLEGETSSIAVDEDFAPPRLSYRGRPIAPQPRKWEGPSAYYEKALLDSLAESMRRSEASRALIDRQRGEYRSQPCRRVDFSRKTIMKFIRAQRMGTFTPDSHQ